MLQILDHTYYWWFHKWANLFAAFKAQFASKFGNFLLHFRVWISCCLWNHIAYLAKLRYKVVIVFFKANIQQFNKLYSNFFRLFREWRVIHSTCYCWKQYLSFFVEAHTLSHLFYQFYGYFSMFFNLIFQCNNQSLRQLFLVKMHKNLFVSLLLKHWTKFHKSLAPIVPVIVLKHIEKPIVSLFEILVLLC